MMLFRPVCHTDIDMLYQLAMDSGVGMTTLAKDKTKWQKRVESSVDSFLKQVDSPRDEDYLFVLEDTDSKKVVGVSAIEASTGSETPFYSYKITRKTRVCYELSIRSDYETLHLVNDHQAHSELCSLYLSSDYRKNKNGLLLSKARFLYMANFKQRFSDIILAEMRGVSNDKGVSPFWENVGHHFFKMDFSKADTLTTSTNKQFIADLMPTNPIHICLLNQDAQQVIGKAHHSTLPAMKILEKEGFHYSGYVDIFDAGPTIESPIDNIATIRRSQIGTINRIIDEVNDTYYFVANTKQEFRASIGNIMYHPENQTCIITHKLALLLNVQTGDQLRLSPIR